MKSKYTNSVTDLLTSSPIFKMWGASTPVAMGDGVRFRVTKSPKVDYVYVRYYAGYEQYEIEFAALVGTEYDIIDRVYAIPAENLIATISKTLFFG